MPPHADPLAEANRIVEVAGEKDIVLRLIGGLAFSVRCPSASHEGLKRKYVDIDFVGYSKQSKGTKQLFSELGYVPRDRFNAMNGDSRLIFNDMENQRRVDIFLDEFRMCHRFDFRDRLGIDERTIPLADLLATKLQIIEINQKDMKDIFSLLVDFEVGETDDGMINGSYLARLCGGDWGVYKTLTLNLDRLLKNLPETGLGASQQALVQARIDQLRRRIEGAPKSLKWRMRERIGERVQWYELPEADKEVVDSRVPGANLGQPASTL